MAAPSSPLAEHQRITPPSDYGLYLQGNWTGSVAFLLLPIRPVEGGRRPPKHSPPLPTISSASESSVAEGETKMRCKLLLALAAGAMSAVFAQQAAAQPECTVGTVGYLTIQNAVKDEECRMITVPAGTFLENVYIDRSVTIRGAGPKLTTVDGSGLDDSVFLIGGTFASACASPNVYVTLEGMTITGGKGPPEGDVHRNGGGISASPFVDLVVKDCVVTGNSTYRYGGGISVANGRLTVMDSVISLNTAYVTDSPQGYLGGGGGVRVQGCPSDLTVVNSIIEKNVSRHLGGGILSVASPDRGRLILKDSDIRGNEAWATNGGGGVFFDGVVVTWSDTKVKDNVPNDVQDGPPAP